MDFINRAQGTIFENELEIIFNLFLVSQGARRTYLFEASNHSQFDTVTLFEEIKQTYPEFKYLVESQINDIPHRVFFFINDLLPFKKDETHDNWLARNLGFNCIGIPNDDAIKYSLHYSLSDGYDEISFYSEVCPSLDSIQSKKDIFEPLANSIGYNLIEKILTHKPISIWLEAVSNMGKLDGNMYWLIDNASDFVEELFGSGLEHIIDENKDHVTNVIELLRNNYKYLLFTTIRLSKYCPFFTLGTYRTEEAVLLYEIEKKLFKSNMGPIDAFNQAEKELKQYIPRLWTQENSEKFNKQKTILFDLYSNLLEKISLDGSSVSRKYFIKY